MQNAEQLLKQSLEEERLQAVLLKNQISMLEQKLATLHNDPRPSLSPIMVDVCMQTTDVSKSEVRAHDAEVMSVLYKLLSMLKLHCTVNDGIVLLLMMHYFHMYS